MTTRRKGNLGVEVFDAASEFFQEEQPNCFINPSSIGEDIDWDNFEQGPDDFAEVQQSQLAAGSENPQELEDDVLQHQDAEYIVDFEESEDEIDLS